MSRDATITLPFGDNEYVFRIATGELVKLQEVRDCGPYVILDRIASHRWYFEDVREVIRLGLIGGGMPPIQALKLVREYVDGRPPLYLVDSDDPAAMSNVAVAGKILHAGLVGATDEKVGETKAADQTESVSTLLKTGS